MKMRVRPMLAGGCVFAALAVCGFPASAVVQECPAGTPTAQSYTWDFKGEANSIFEDLQFDAQQAMYHADLLQSFAQNPELSWETQSDQLNALRTEINDMSPKLCRLEAIRRVVAPWQQAEIDRLRSTITLMADNAEDAILFANAHRNDLWLGTYRQYTNNLYHDAVNLAHTTDDAAAYANVSKEYRDLRHKLRMPATS